MIRYIFAVALFFLNFPAHSAVLFVGSEHADFTGTGTTGAEAASSVRRAEFSRSSIKINRQSAAVPPSNRITSPDFLSASSSFWVTWRIAGTSNGNTSGNIILALRDAGTTRIVLRGTGTSGSFNLQKVTSGGSYTTLGTSAADSMPLTTVASVPNKIDVQIVYAVSGSAKVYFNGAEVISYTGDTTTDGATTLNSLYLGAATSFDETYVSEVIAIEQDTRSLALWSLYPVAAGTTQQWTPNTVGNVSKSNDNDTTYVTTTTNDYISGWTTPTTTPTGTWNLIAVVQSARLMRGGTGPQNFQYYCRSGGTDATSGDISANAGFATYAQYVWTTNCATAAAWAIGDIAAGFNLGIKSRP